MPSRLPDNYKSLVLLESAMTEVGKTYELYIQLMPIIVISEGLDSSI